MLTITLLLLDIVSFIVGETETPIVYLKSFDHSRSCIGYMLNGSHVLTRGTCKVNKNGVSMYMNANFGGDSLKGILDLMLKDGVILSSDNSSMMRLISYYILNTSYSGVQSVGIQDKPMDQWNECSLVYTDRRTSSKIIKSSLPDKPLKKCSQVEIESLLPHQLYKNNTIFHVSSHIMEALKWMQEHTRANPVETKPDTIQSDEHKQVKVNDNEPSVRKQPEDDNREAPPENPSTGDENAESKTSADEVNEMADKAATGDENSLSAPKASADNDIEPSEKEATGDENELPAPKTSADSDADSEPSEKMEAGDENELPSPAESANDATEPSEETPASTNEDEDPSEKAPTDDGNETTPEGSTNNDELTASDAKESSAAKRQIKDDREPSVPKSGGQIDFMTNIQGCIEIDHTTIKDFIKKGDKNSGAIVCGNPPMLSALFQTTLGGPNSDKVELKKGVVMFTTLKGIMELGGGIIESKKSLNQKGIHSGGHYLRGNDTSSNLMSSETQIYCNNFLILFAIIVVHILTVVVWNNFRNL